MYASPLRWMLGGATMYSSGKDVQRSVCATVDCPSGGNAGWPSEIEVTVIAAPNNRCSADAESGCFCHGGWRSPRLITSAAHFSTESGIPKYWRGAATLFARAVATCRRTRLHVLERPDHRRLARFRDVMVAAAQPQVPSMLGQQSTNTARRRASDSSEVLCTDSGVDVPRVWRYAGHLVPRFVSPPVPSRAFLLSAVQRCYSHNRAVIGRKQIAF